jgi:hypothetical protein
VPNASAPKFAKLDPETQVLAWIAALQDARRKHDFPAAARAEHELEALGYVVRIVRPIPRPVAVVPP